MTDEETYEQLVHNRPKHTIRSTVRRGRKMGKPMPHLRLTRNEILQRYQEKYGTRVAILLDNWYPRCEMHQREIAKLMGVSTQAVGDILKRLKAAA